jgi:hypothetical protein
VTDARLRLRCQFERAGRAADEEEWVKRRRMEEGLMRERERLRLREGGRIE